MAARGQQNFGIVPEAAGGATFAGPVPVIDSLPALEQHQTLVSLRHQLGDQLTRDGAAVIHDNSPRFLGPASVQSAQQPYGAGVDPSGCYQYEDFAGILGERLASGSLSDVSASASDKIYSGYSSSGEHHGPRVKFMCSFGGKILPRPGDGKLRYAGGETRITAVYRHTKYNDLMQKMGRLYGQPVLVKYQLPNEDLDALISVSCDEDVENMMEEYDRLQESDGSNRLRIFLFSPADHDLAQVSSTVELRNTDQIYMDAINGMPETRTMSTVPISCNVVTGQQVPDSMYASRVLNNLPYALPLVSNPQLVATIGQAVPGVLLQPGKQIFSRILSSVSPSAPPSPTISSHLSQFRQPVISDPSLVIYGDQMLKGPGTHLHDLQRIDALHKVDVGVGSGASSLNSQHDSPYWHFDPTRLSESPRKAQYDRMVDHVHRQGQGLMAEPIVPQMTLNSGMPHPDSFGRLPRVGSDRSLMALQQQHLEFSAPIVHPDALQQPALDFQNLIIQDQSYPLQSVWQQQRETRQEGFQRLKPVRLSAPENMQGLAMAPQQLRVSQYPPSGQEVAIYNQLDQSGNVMSGLLSHKPLTVQTSSAEQVAVPAVPLGSAPSSPRVKFLDMNSNNSGMQPDRGGYHGGFMEQPSHQLMPQAQVEPALRGLKPLNTHLHQREQVLLVDDQVARQQLPSPLFRHQEIRGGTSQQDGDRPQVPSTEGLIQSRTPLYTGSSPYSEHQTPFSDQRFLRGEGQELVQRDDNISVYSNQQEGFDWRTKKPLNEQVSMAWTGTGQKGISESLFVNPMWSTAAYFDAHAPSESSSTPATVLPIILDGGKIPSGFTYLPSSEVLAGSSESISTGTEDQLQTAASVPVSDMFTTRGNVNSLFEADIKEGCWVKGIQARSSEETQGLLDKALEITDSSLVVGGPSRRTSDKDVHALNEPVMSPIGKLNDSFLGHTNLLTSVGASNYIDSSSRQNMPLSPRFSAGGLPLTSPLSLAVEASTGANCLTEIIKDYKCGDFASYIPKDGSGFSMPDFVFSDGGRPSGTQSPILGPTPQTAKAVEVKDDFPIFDSDSVEESEQLKLLRSSTTSTTAEADKAASIPPEADNFPSTLYTAPTLSMQNWEVNLGAARMEELVTETNQETLDNKELHIWKGEAVESNVEKSLEDADQNDENTNLAAVAEAEAVSRGLQTIRNSDLEELRELGTGTFGTVYHGKWRGTDVAIKRIKSSCFSGRPSERDRLIADFWKEAYILGQLHHPNVVAFYGVVPDGPGGTLATVTEYMVNGSIKQVLQKKDRTIDRRKRLLIVMDAAFGMEYLHGKNIVHFDLKCENLLVNMKDPQRPICKVGDLGLSKVKQQTMVSGGVRGTLPWMAPELLNGSSNLVSEKVDVFSFGIVMWELLTGEEPYANMHYGAIIGGIVNNTLRPPVPSWCDPSWKTLMERCWSADPGARPTFLEISAELRAMATSKSQGQVSGAVSGDSNK